MLEALPALPGPMAHLRRFIADRDGQASPAAANNDSSSDEDAFVRDGGAGAAARRPSAR